MVCSLHAVPGAEVNFALPRQKKKETEAAIEYPKKEKSRTLWIPC
jgi:hypothetical protein